MSRGGGATEATGWATAAPAESMGSGGGAAQPLAGPEARAVDSGQRWGKSADQAAALVGSVDNRKMDVARRLLAAIPQAIREKVRDPDGAAATVVALLLAQNDVVMKAQLEAGAKTDGAFAAGARDAGRGGWGTLPRNGLGLERGGGAWGKFRDLAPIPRGVVGRALFAPVTADGTIRIIEAALMRTVGAVL